jgi:hypothetical protein
VQEKINQEPCIQKKQPPHPEFKVTEVVSSFFNGNFCLQMQKLDRRTGWRNLIEEFSPRPTAKDVQQKID